MKKYLLSLMLLFSVGAVAVPAAAVPVVAADSTYTVYLQGVPGEVALLTRTVFDDAESQDFYGNVAVSISESETILTSGNSLITVNLRADSSLFTDPDQIAVFGIGVDEDGDGFDLTTPVNLVNVTARFYGSNGAVLATFTDFSDAIFNPWDGRFGLVGLGEETLDARLITGISFDFEVAGDVTAVPEPDSILLCGIGLMAAMAASYRRRRKV